jgi:hypothetical protein
MAITKTVQTASFEQLHRGQPFAIKKVLYTRSDEEKEYMCFKLSRNKAITVDKRTVIYITDKESVIPCVMNEPKQRN